jgi:hypothetical protein
MENVIESIESEVSKLLNESLEESAKNSNMATAEYDEGWYAGEMNAYEKVFNFIEKLKEKDLEASKRIIGYDDCGKPLHEGDFCTFDVNVTDWENIYIPNNVKVKTLAHGLFKTAQFEGQVTYNEQDKCYELSIDNDYCPALYFHAIEPGTLRVKESKEQVKDDIRINPDRINFLEISNENACKITRLSASPELDKIMGIYTKKSHEFAFSVNYYARLQDTNEFDVIACVEINNKNWLRRDFPDVADKVIKLADTYRNIEPVVIPLNKEELNIIEEKFNDYYINVYGNDDIER